MVTSSLITMSDPMILEITHGNMHSAPFVGALLDSMDRILAASATLPHARFPRELWSSNVPPLAGQAWHCSVLIFYGALKYQILQSLLYFALVHAFDGDVAFCSIVCRASRPALTYQAAYTPPTTNKTV
jgi:hypothetical protein